MFKKTITIIGISNTTAAENVRQRRMMQRCLLSQLMNRIFGFSRSREVGIYETCLNAARRRLSTNQRRAGCLSLKLPDLLAAAAAAAQPAFTSLPPLTLRLTQAGRHRVSLRFQWENKVFSLCLHNILYSDQAQSRSLATLCTFSPRRTTRTSSRSSDRHPHSTPFKKNIYIYILLFSFFFFFWSIIDCFDHSDQCPAATSPWMFPWLEQTSVTEHCAGTLFSLVQPGCSSPIWNGRFSRTNSLRGSSTVHACLNLSWFWGLTQ